jgi:hypothetical protein
VLLCDDYILFLGGGVILLRCQYLRLYTYVEWVVRLVNRELERKLPWPNRGTIPSFAREDWEHHETLLSGWLVSNWVPIEYKPKAVPLQQPARMGIWSPSQFRVPICNKLMSRPNMYVLLKKYVDHSELQSAPDNSYLQHGTFPNPSHRPHEPLPTPA